VTDLGKVLPDHAAWQRAARTVSLIGGASRCSGRRPPGISSTSYWRTAGRGTWWRSATWTRGKWASHIAGRRVAVWISPSSTVMGCRQIADRHSDSTQPPAAVCTRAANPIHRGSNKDGRICQRAMAQCAGIDRGRNDHCLRSPPDCRRTAISNTGRGWPSPGA
jgi:hypothetical protein